MYRIEFIGAPAIGKSTVLKETIKLRGKNDFWLTSKEARIKIAKNKKYNKFNIQKLFQFCLKMDIFKKMHNSLSSFILKEYENYIWDIANSKYNDLVNLFLNDIYSRKDLSSMEKLVFISFYNSLLIKEYMIFDYFKINNLLVYDEGIIHNNEAFINEKLCGEFIKKNIQLKTNIIPSGIIYCFINNESVYLKRRIERIKKGNGVFFERQLNNKEIELLCSRSLKSANDKVNIFRKYSIPILEIDMSNPIEDNAKEAYKFISEFK